MAQRYDYYFRQKVTEAELDAGFTGLENADWALSSDTGLVGAMANAVVTEKSGTPNLTVDVTGSAVIYNKLGQRITIGPAQNVDVSVDESAVSTAVATPGNEKLVSLFAKFDRTLTDPRIDGNSLTVFFNRAPTFAFVVRQGAETASPPATPVVVDGTHILLADIRRNFGQTQIFNADITPPGGSYTGIANRREDAFVASAGALAVRTGTADAAVQALLTEINNVVTGTFPATAITASIAATWHDTTGIAGTDVDAAIEEIVTDLASTSGSDKVGGAAYAASLLTLAAGSVQDQIHLLFDRANDRFANFFFINHPDNATDTNIFSLTGGGALAYNLLESLPLGNLKSGDYVVVHYNYAYQVGNNGESGKLRIRITEAGVQKIAQECLCDDNITVGARDQKSGQLIWPVTAANPATVVEVHGLVNNAVHTLNINSPASLYVEIIRGPNWP